MSQECKGKRVLSQAIETMLQEKPLTETEVLCKCVLPSTKQLPSSPTLAHVRQFNSALTLTTKS